MLQGRRNGDGKRIKNAVIKAYPPPCCAQGGGYYTGNKGGAGGRIAVRAKFFIIIANIVKNLSPKAPDSEISPCVCVAHLVEMTREGIIIGFLSFQQQRNLNTA